MGLIRLLLALSVLYGHSGSPFLNELKLVPGNEVLRHIFINASAAVICFFTISGFYMAYVINEKYKTIENWRRKFLISRYLRLWPTYAMFLTLSLAFELYFGIPNFVYGFQTTFLTHATNAFINIFIVGQDIFAAYVGHAFNGDVLSVVPVGQAWSIAVELELYVIAALLFSTRLGILASLGIGLALRLLMQHLGLIASPTGHMIMLNVLVFFALGGCGYLLFKIIDKWDFYVRLLIAGLILSAIATYIEHFSNFFGMEARGNDYSFIPLYVGTALATPFVFSLTKNSKLDNLFGNLSYPVYLGHILVFNVIRNITSYSHSRFYLPTALYVNIFIILILSYWIVKVVEERVNEWRRKLC